MQRSRDDAIMPTVNDQPAPKIDSSRTIDAFRELVAPEDGDPGSHARTIENAAETPAPDVLSGKHTLIVVAAPAECRAVLKGIAAKESTRVVNFPGPTTAEPIRVSSRFSVICTGVGKANAAIATTRALESQNNYSVVLNLGIGGALPTPEPLQLTAVAVARECIFADEGVATPAGFDDVAAIGFPPDAGIPGGTQSVRMPSSSATTASLASHLNAPTVPFATVSTCSGTDSLAAAIHSRTSASVEDMESAAVALAVMHANQQETSIKSFSAVRTISNTTGSEQSWALPASLHQLSIVAAML